MKAAGAWGRLAWILAAWLAGERGARGQGALQPATLPGPAQVTLTQLGEDDGALSNAVAALAAGVGAVDWGALAEASDGVAAAIETLNEATNATGRIADLMPIALTNSLGAASWTDIEAIQRNVAALTNWAQGLVNLDMVADPWGTWTNFPAEMAAATNAAGAAYGAMTGVAARVAARGVALQALRASVEEDHELLRNLTHAP